MNRPRLHAFLVWLLGDVTPKPCPPMNLRAVGASSYEATDAALRDRQFARRQSYHLGAMNPQVAERTAQAQAAIAAHVSARMDEIRAAEDDVARRSLALAQPERVYLIRWIDRPLRVWAEAHEVSPRGLVSVLPNGHPALDPRWC